MGAFKSTTINTALANLREMEGLAHAELLRTGDHTTAENWHIIRNSRESCETFANRVLTTKGRVR